MLRRKTGMTVCATLRVMCIGMLAWIAGALPAWSATRHVVLLFDERPELPGLAALEADLVRALGSSSADHIEVYREAMDLSRFGSTAYQRSFQEFLRTKYADKKIDVAVAIMAPALDFLLSYGDAIFPGTPIVFCGIDSEELSDRALPSHVRGILVKREFAPTLELALGLHPQTQRVAVVAGTSEFDSLLLEQARKEFHAFESRVAFTYLTELPLPKLLAELSQLPPQTIVLFVSFFQDGARETFVPHNVVQRVSVAANAPVYAFVDQYLGRGIVGGNLYSLSEHGTGAAKLVLQALESSVPSGTAVSEVNSNRVLFDWRQMQRWGIGQSSLPAGSEIRFRDPSVWAAYKVQILGIVGIVLGQSALIGWLLYERQQRRRSEAEAHDLSGRLITGQEEERSRLGRELHDDVTQRLALLAIDVGREERNPTGIAALRNIRKDLVRLSGDVHALSYRLHPSILEDLGLHAALKSECEHFSETCSFPVELSADGMPEHVPHDIALCLFRIAQESLRNAARHASASHVEIRVRRLDSGLQLTVTDNGLGFDSEQPRARASLGLASMRQRVALLGGKLKVDSQRFKGTTISAWVPLREAPAEPVAPATG
jgi:signal transduction histidine kinase